MLCKGFPLPSIELEKKICENHSNNNLMNLKLIKKSPPRFFSIIKNWSVMSSVDLCADSDCFKIQTWEPHKF